MEVEIVKQLEQSDKTCTSDSYLSFSDYNSYSFGVRGSPWSVFKSTEKLYESFGPTPIANGHSQPSNWTENILNHTPPEPETTKKCVTGSELETGDILLFSSDKDGVCKTLRQLQWSAFSQAALVVKLDGIPYCLMATNHACLDESNATKNKDVSCIYLASLSFVRQRFHADQIAVRRITGIAAEKRKAVESLACSLTSGEKDMIMLPELQKWIFGNVDLAQLPSSFWLGRRHVKNNNIFLSSQLIASVLLHCGIVDTKVSTDLFVPEVFNRLTKNALCDETMEISHQMTLIV